MPQTYLWLPCKFTLKQEVSSDLAAKFTVRYASEDLFAELLLRQETRNLKAEFIAARNLTQSLFADFLPRYEDDQALFIDLIIRNIGSEGLFSKFAVGQGRAELHADFTLRQDIEDLLGQFVIIHSTSREVFADFEIAHWEDLLSYLLIPKIGESGTGSLDMQGEQYIAGSRFKMGHRRGLVEEIYVYAPAGGFNARCAIYTVGGDGRPDQLLIQTAITALGAGWTSLALENNIHLEPGTEYFLLDWLSSAAGTQYNKAFADPDSTKGWTKQVFQDPGSFPSLLLGGVFRARRMSIYAPYTVFDDDSEDLKAVFHVGRDSEELFAQFTVAQGWGDFKSRFEIRYGYSELPCEFTVKAPTGIDLKAIFNIPVTDVVFCKFTVAHRATRRIFSKFFLRNPSEILKALFSVIHSSSQELFLELAVRQETSEDLFADFEIRQETSEDLGGLISIRQSTSEALYAKFEIQDTAELKAEFYLAYAFNQPNFDIIVDDDLATWINYIHTRGHGYISDPTIANDVNRVSGANSAKITSTYGSGQNDEVTFGWSGRQP